MPIETEGERRQAEPEMLMAWGTGSEQRVKAEQLPAEARAAWQRLEAARLAAGQRLSAAIAALPGGRISPTERKAFAKFMNAVESAEKWAGGFIAGKGWADPARVAGRVETAACVCEAYARGARSV